MPNKYPGYCIDCQADVPAGHGDLKKVGSRWQVTCGGKGRVAQAKQAVRNTRQPLNSPGRGALQGRSRADFSMGEESPITRIWTLRDKPDQTDIGQTMLATKGDEQGQYLTCVGFSAHYVSQQEADDFDLVGPSGDFGRHWSVTRYYRIATDEEAQACAARMKAKDDAKHFNDLCNYRSGPAIATARNLAEKVSAAEIEPRVSIWKKYVGYSLHQAWRVPAGLLSLHPVYDDDTYYHLLRYEDMTPEDADLVRSAPEVK